jgi:nicotinamide-nucleotide amidase
MRLMLDEQVLPRVAEIMGDRRRHCLIRNISTFGLTESATGERLEGFSRRFASIRLGLRAKFPEIHVRLYAYGGNAAELERSLGRAADWVKERIGEHVVSEAGESLEAAVGRMLVDRGATLAVAESCTGGLIADRLTDVPGSSAYFLMSAVTYADAAKVRLLGVSKATLASHGAVDEVTVGEMAAGARRVSGADYALATSGIAGPDGGTPDKPVGTVCIGLATPRDLATKRFTFFFGRRILNKRIFAATALDLLRRRLLSV